MGRPRGSRTSAHWKRESRGEAGIIPQHLVVRTHITRGVVLSVTAVIVLGACPHAGRAAQDVAPPAAPLPLLPAVTAWESRLPDLPAAPAAQDAERVYVPLADGSLLALDRATGGQAWTASSLGRSTPLVGRDRIHAAAAGALVTLDAATGRALWRASVAGLAETGLPGVVAPGGTIVVRTARGLLALRDADGNSLWEHALARAGDTAALVPGRDAVYVTDAAGVAAIGLDDGRVRWRRDLPGTAGTPALVGDRLLVGTADKEIVALRAASGDPTWRWRLGGAFVGAAERDGVVYVAALDALLRALRRVGGNQVWRLELDTRPTAPPVVHGDVVVQAGNDPVLSAVDVRTGMVVARHTEDGDLLGPPLVAPGADVPLVLLFQDGRVVGLKAEARTEPEPAATPTPPDSR